MLNANCMLSYPSVLNTEVSSFQWVGLEGFCVAIWCADPLLFLSESLNPQILLDSRFCH